MQKEAVPCQPLLFYNAIFLLGCSPLIIPLLFRYSHDDGYVMKHAKIVKCLSSLEFDKNNNLLYISKE